MVGAIGIEPTTLCMSSIIYKSIKYCNIRVFRVSVYLVPTLVPTLTAILELKFPKSFCSFHAEIVAKIQRNRKHRPRRSGARYTFS